MAFVFVLNYWNYSIKRTESSLNSSCCRTLCFFPCRSCVCALSHFALRGKNIGHYASFSNLVWSSRCLPYKFIIHADAHEAKFVVLVRTRGLGDTHRKKRLLLHDNININNNNKRRTQLIKFNANGVSIKPPPQGSKWVRTCSLRSILAEFCIIYEFFLGASNVNNCMVSIRHAWVKGSILSSSWNEIVGKGK